MATIAPQVLCEAYHGILELGLENLQRTSLPEFHAYLRIEIDHLHNIPLYMHSDNLFRHAYYYCTERPFYLERVATYSTTDVGRMLAKYELHWKSLRIQLIPFAEVINTKQYTEKL